MSAHPRQQWLNVCLSNLLIIIESQGCILPPCPQGHGQGGFFVQKKIDERFQSNATFLFSKKKSERPEKLIILSLPASTGKERLVKL